MKKIILMLFCVVFLVASLYLAANMAVESFTKKAVAYVKAEGPKHGVEILDVSWQDSFFKLPSKAYLLGVGVRAKVSRKDLLPSERTVEVFVEKMSFQVKDFGDRTFRLLATEMMVDLLPEGDADGGGGKQNLVKGKEAEILFELKDASVKTARQHARKAAEELKDLLLGGTTALPVSFVGIASFPVEEGIVKARISVLREGGISRLTIDKEDVVIISRRFDLGKPLTEAEVDVVSRNPLRAYRLFQLRTDAKETASDAWKKNRKVPEDAYRHVLWSVLLTREYGEDFAKTVTDAHEEGRTGNTPKERLMDLKNNRLGREYARSGAGRSGILKFVMGNPEVIRRPQDVRR